jgi:hypothetical protein
VQNTPSPDGRRIECASTAFPKPGIYGQESNNTTWRLAKMNLAIRGIEANIVWNEGMLSAVRDALLPKLLSGELRVRPSPEIGVE